MDTSNTVSKTAMSVPARLGHQFKNQNLFLFSELVVLVILVVLLVLAGLFVYQLDVS